MKKYIAIALIGVCVSCASSGDRQDKSSASQVEVTEAEPMEFDRLDNFMSGFASLSPQARLDGIDSLRPGLEALWMLSSRGAGGDLTPEAVTQMAGSRAFQVFAPDIAGRFSSADSVAAVLGVFAANLGKQLPEIHMPHLYGAVISYNQGIVNVGDTVMLVGLNHYLGSDYPGYTNFPEWQRDLKIPARLPVDIAEALIATQAPDPTDGTALSEMIHSGAVLAAMRRTLPGIDAASALGLTPDQWQWLKDNEAQIWKKLIADNLLYSSDPAVARRLTAPGPSTSLLHPDAPPRAGVYIGWRIVEDYMANVTDPTKRTIAYILSPEFAALRPQTILTDASYMPQ